LGIKSVSISSLVLGEVVSILPDWARNHFSMLVLSYEKPSNATTGSTIGVPLREHKMSDGKIVPAEEAGE
jgi:hypothetical protein